MKTKLHLLRNKVFSAAYMECAMLGIGIAVWGIAYSCSNFNLAIAGITVIFLVNLIYSIRCFKEQFVFFFMQLSIFTFLISRPMIGWLSGIEWWLVTGNSLNNYEAYIVKSSGYLDENTASGYKKVRPTVMLNNNVMIKSGSGSASNPFILK